MISDLVVDILFMHSLLSIFLLYMATTFYTEGVLHEIVLTDRATSIKFQHNIIAMHLTWQIY